MVVCADKFLCGLGCVPLYYCDICCRPYAKEKEARECEISHREERSQLKPLVNDQELEMHTKPVKITR